MNKFKIAILVGAVSALVACDKSEPTASVEQAVSAAPVEMCGDVTIADMNWSSATLMANVDSLILSKGFGCNVEIVPGDTMPTGTSMIERGEPDIAPELWSNSMKDALDRGVEEGRLLYAGNSLSDGGEEGLWVPKYLVDKMPELATIEGIIANAELFTHPEDPNKSMIMGCPAGWNCQISVSNLYRALGLEEAGFDLVDPGSGAGLAGAIAKAYEREEAWFGYYWAPTDILGKYEMVKVDFGTGVDEAMFTQCITQIECEDPKPTMYPSSPVQTVTTADFANESPAAFGYVQSRSYTNPQMGELLAWMADNQADGEFAAYHFLENYESIWTQWVSEDVANKVKAAL